MYVQASGGAAAEAEAPRSGGPGGKRRPILILQYTNTNTNMVLYRRDR